MEGGADVSACEDVAVSAAVTSTVVIRWQGPTKEGRGSRSPQPRLARIEVSDRHGHNPITGGVCNHLRSCCTTALLFINKSGSCTTLIYGKLIRSAVPPKPEALEAVHKLHVGVQVYIVLSTDPILRLVLCVHVAGFWGS
ncbi:hypothetical protein Plo01_43000 [Planobispora longispora]|uniref:Uncharacterized protein n=1 Tax=Planobispora longispora TaxID=28887 RepID=A0A8J3RPH9_9ACTN|nr:hypothetical protein Plo01_43000 [Planobispora longispora]